MSTQPGAPTVLDLPDPYDAAAGVLGPLAFFEIGGVTPFLPFAVTSAVAQALGAFGIVDIGDLDARARADIVGVPGFLVATFGRAAAPLPLVQRPDLLRALEAVTAAELASFAASGVGVLQQRLAEAQQVPPSEVLPLGTLTQIDPSNIVFEGLISPERIAMLQAVEAAGTLDPGESVEEAFAQISPQASSSEPVILPPQPLTREDPFASSFLVGGPVFATLRRLNLIPGVIRDTIRRMWGL